MIRRTGAACAAFLPLAAPRAEAHVKWFTVTNVHDAPVGLSGVLSPVFLSVLVLFGALVFLGFILDGWVARRFPAIVSSGAARAAIEERLIRAATGAYLVYISSGGTVILTPELRTGAAWPATLQFLCAFFLIWRSTCPLSGLGLLVLYADGILRFGAFHLADYVFVPCLALYLLSLSIGPAWLARHRQSVLTAGLAFSLAWTAIEKFLYPQWTDAVVATHPSIALGLPLPLVVVVAGFVEFTLAFYLVTGRGLLRLGGVGYASIFMAAMPAFGKLDVFGHLTIIAVLCVVMLRGATPMQEGLHLPRLRGGSGLHHGPAVGTVADAAWVLLLYLCTLAVFFAAYYAMQRT